MKCLCLVTVHVDVVLVARRKNVVHTDAARHTLVYQAPSVLRLLLKRFMQVLLPRIIFITCISIVSEFVCVLQAFDQSISHALAYFGKN